MIGAVFVLACIAWYPLFRNEFLMWDDDFNLYQNDIILHGSWTQFWDAPYMGFYIPLTYTIWYYIAKIFGLDSPVPFAGINFVFHLINSTLLFFYMKVLLEKIYTPRDRAPDRKLKGAEKKQRELEEAEAARELDRNIDWASLIAALIYLFHPLQVGAVAWHSGFRDLLSHFWAFLLLNLLLRSQTRRTILIAMGLFALSLLSKPSSVAMPVIVGALAWLLPGVNRKSLTIFALVALIPGIYFSLKTREIQSQFMIGLQSADVPDRPIIVADSYGFYVRQFFGGAPLSADYGRTPPHVLNWDMWHETVPWLVVFLIAVPLLLWKRWTELFVFGALWTLPLAPTSGVVQFNFQRISTVADHYFVTALPAFCFLIAILVMRPPKFTGEKSLGWLALPIIFIWGVKTHLRIADWHDNQSFFHSILNTNPYSHSANNYLGYFAFQAKDYVTAEKYFRQATASLPISAISSGNLAYSWLRLNRNQDVVNYLKDKVVDPDFIAQNMVHQHVIAVNYLALGLAQANLTQYEKAFHSVCEMFKYNPLPPDRHDGEETLQKLRQTMKPPVPDCPYFKATTAQSP